jgi:hypothetical protein
MEKKELLETLSALTARYEQHRHYIEKARAQGATGKFNAAVIEKVVLDHEIKASDVADQVSPLLPSVSSLLAGYTSEKSKIEASKGGVDEQIQELELRAAIGELSEADFDSETAGLRASQASANERIAAVQADWDSLDAALARWAATAGPGGHYSAAASPAAEPADEPAAEEDPASAAEPVVDEDEPEAVDSEGAYSAMPERREDLSVLFPGSVDSATVRASSGEEDIAIETSEIGEDEGDAPSADLPFGYDEEILGGEVSVSAGEVEIDLSGESGAAAPAPSESGEAPRRALLLYQEGTAEEQIYPFTGDTLTIGRGRENDIQIKNDSKVSRYHCKLFRRGNNFYIEDQKSSNGSLVNGELITDRRLFGGEEIIIGETFFRFRIME